MMSMIMRRVVVFPAPLRPSRPKIEPWGTSNDSPSTAAWSPKLFFSLDSEIAGSIEPPRIERVRLRARFARIIDDAAINRLTPARGAD